MSYHLVDYLSDYEFYFILDTSDLTIERLNREDMKKLSGIEIEGIEWFPSFKVVDYPTSFESKLAVMPCTYDITNGVLTELMADNIVLGTGDLRGIFASDMYCNNVKLKLSDSLSFISYAERGLVEGLTIDVSDVTRYDLLIMAYTNISAKVVDRMHRSKTVKPIANIFNRDRNVKPAQSMSKKSDELFCSMFKEYINKPLDICVYRRTARFNEYVDEYREHRSPTKFNKILSTLFSYSSYHAVNALVMYIIQGGRNQKMHDKYERLCELCRYTGRYVLQ